MIACEYEKTSSVYTSGIEQKEKETNLKGELHLRKSNAVETQFPKEGKNHTRIFRKLREKYRGFDLKDPRFNLQLEVNIEWR